MANLLVISIIVQIFAILLAFKVLKKIGGLAYWLWIMGGMLVLGLVHCVMLSLWYADRYIDIPGLLEFFDISISVLYFLIVALFAVAIKTVKTKEQQKEDEQIKLMYQNSPLGYQSLDKDGDIIDVNPTWLDLLGYKREDVIGKNFGEFISNADKPLFKERFPNFKECGIVRGVQFHMIKNTGEIVLVEIDGNIALTDDGKFKQTHCVLRNITDKKRNEEEMARLTREVQVKNEELQSLISAISHDLRTPLVNIKGFSSEIAKGSAKTLELANELPDGLESVDGLKKIIHDDIIEPLHFIETSSGKIERLIDGLSDLARIGELKFDLKQIDMNELLKNVVKGQEFQIRQANAEVKIGNLPECLGDNCAITRIFSNLLSNSLKYLQVGRKGVITIEGEACNGYCRYDVTDNGIGIDNKYINEIFKPFRRLNERDVQGEGLGLNIVQAILNRLNGCVSVESKYGQGSKFSVYLPYF